MRSARDAAASRADAAESDLAAAVAARAEADAARAGAQAASRALAARLELADLAASRAQADAEAHAERCDALEALLGAASLRADTAEAGVEDARRAAAEARSRAREGEHLIAEQRAALHAQEAEVVRAQEDREAALASQQRTAAQLIDVTTAEAGTRDQVKQQAGRIAALEEALEAEQAQRARVQASLDKAEAELKRRPALDALKGLDIETLMQRNLQAAAAMQSLMQLAAGGATQ
jgi:hypothetical protein